MMGAASGHYFENYVVGELMKSYAAGRNKANLSYYRDGSAKEIDVVIEENGVLHPLEIKKSANPDLREVRKFELLDAATLGQYSDLISVSLDSEVDLNSL